MSRSEVSHVDTLNGNLNICAGDFADDAAMKCADGSHGISCDVSDEGAEEFRGVCMPSPCALGCSFDRELLNEVGKAVGSMAAEYGYNAVISPDVSVVRSPLYGGAAECFGEDPYLCGTLGAEWVSGVQSVGTAAVLDNFMGANQLRGKFTCDSIIDKKALREVYLKPFEMTIKLAHPRAVYCGCNKVNGLECCENSVLLTDILRSEWNFDGAVLSDMRLCPDSAASFGSGVNMSFPKGGSSVKRRLARAVESGEIPQHYPEISAKRISEMLSFDDKSCGERMNEDECRSLAVRAAEQCAVLIKNHRSTLPIPLSSSIALIGHQAKIPRIQRGGLHTVNSGRLQNMLSVFDQNQVRYKYCEGYAPAVSHDDGQSADELLAQAVKCASNSEFAVIFAGFDDLHDNASIDRRTNQLPKSQVKLINAVAKVNSNTIVVVNGSALPKMNWIGRVKAVLYMPLCGEGMCQAAFDLLFGFANPCGRLAVSNSLNEADMPCGDTFGNDDNVSEYRESIYVGYRYYNKAGLYAAFPFGYGLSYTSFEYSDMKASKCSEGWQISLKVKNVGKRDGAEIVQIYVEAPKTEKFRAVRELKQYCKVFLTKGEERAISVILPREAFACYDTEFSRLRVNSGRYRICAAAASNDIRAEAWVSVKGEPPRECDVPSWYVKPSGRPSEADFQRLFGKRMPNVKPMETVNYSVGCTLNQLRDIWIFRLAVRIIKEILRIITSVDDLREPEYAERADFILNMPVNRLCGLCHGLYPMKLTKLIIKIANMSRRKLQ